MGEVSRCPFAGRVHMARSKDIARMLWESGGPALQDVACSGIANVPGARPLSDQAFEIYCMFVERFRRVESQQYRSLVPTSATFRSEDRVSPTEAIEALSRMQGWLIIHEFPVDIHVGEDLRELLTYVRGLTPMDELGDIYFLQSDYTCAAARTHHDQWYVLVR